MLSGKFSNLNNETFQQFSNLQIVELGQIDGLVDVSMLGMSHPFELLIVIIL